MNKKIKNLLLNQYMQSLKKDRIQVLARIYQTIRVPVYNYALAITKNVQNAEDILQETILKIYQERYNYHEDNPLAWILTIVKNKALMLFRKEQKTIVMPDDFLLNYPDQTPLGKDEIILIEYLLTKLKTEEREIVILHIIAGLNHKEIAAHLKLPIGTVLSKYKRTLAKIRQMAD